MPQPDSKQVEALLKGIAIPPQPKILLDLTKIFQQEEPDFRKIISLVSSDVALSAKMIKLVNSPLFGARSRIESINQALMLLGSQNFYNLVLASTLQSAFAARKEDKAHIDTFLDHSLKIAKICEVITAKRPEINCIVSRDMAYMTGLFHDCSIPLLLGKYPDYKEVFASVLNNSMPVAMEDQRFSTNHAMVGYFMAKSWYLPMPVCQAILNHSLAQYEGSSASTVVEKKLWAVLVLAELISPMIVDAHFQGGHARPGVEWIESHHEVIEELMVDESAITDIVDGFDEHFTGH